MKCLIILAALLIPSFSAAADLSVGDKVVMHLKDGSTVSGTVTSSVDGKISLDGSGAWTTWDIADTERIDDTTEQAKLAERLAGAGGDVEQMRRAAAFAVRHNFDAADLQAVQAIPSRPDFTRAQAPAEPPPAPAPDVLQSASQPPAFGVGIQAVSVDPRDPGVDYSQPNPAAATIDFSAGASSPASLPQAPATAAPATPPAP